MLESIRKRQQGLMIVVAAIIIISFAYFYNQLDVGSPVGQTYAFSINGKKVRYEEAERVARAALVVSNDLNRRDMLQALGTSDAAGLVQNIFILRRQSKELGVEATDDEIMDVVRNAPRFQAAGRYDSKTFQTYLSEEVERRGIPAKLFFQSVGDTVLYEKLQAVVTAGLNPTPLEVDLAFQREYEKTLASVVTLNRTDFASGIGITDEDIQDYYDTHKDTLKSPERRQIEYVFLEQPKHPRTLRMEQERAKAQPTTPVPTPQAPPPPAETDPASAPAETESETPAETGTETSTETDESPSPPDTSANCGGQIEEEDAAETSEASDSIEENAGSAESAESAAPSDPSGLQDPSPSFEPGGLLDFDPLTGEDTPAAESSDLLDPNVTLEPTPSEEDLNAQRAQDQKETEEYQRQLKDFQVRVGDFAHEVISTPEGVNASTHFREITAREGFTLQAPPPFTRDDAPAELKSAREIIPEIFRRDLDDPISDPVRGLGGFYVFHLLSIEEPKPLSLEEAREQIRDALITEKSDERLRAAAKDHRAALIAAVEAGTDFAAAAASRQLSPREIPEFTASKPPTADPQATQIVDAASVTPEGGISEPVDITDGLLLVHVRQRIPAPAESDPAAAIPEPASPPSMQGQMPTQPETPKQQREKMGEYLETSTRFLAFQAWLEHQRELARIVVPADAAPIRLN